MDINSGGISFKIFRNNVAVQDFGIKNSGIRYEGELAPGFKKHGYGIYTWEDGAKYEGKWKDDMKHGKGVFTLPSGAFFEGYWELDRVIRPKGNKGDGKE